MNKLSLLASVFVRLLAPWSPFVAKPPAVAQGELGLIDTNGVSQWALREKPLYFFVSDSKTGDLKRIAGRPSGTAATAHGVP